uniref:Uncharacterized protein n=1 Tax=Siphoviridae sp. ct89S11 TaxID=2825357 RepID=A0A8S5UR03_9CAUD|nr:MAG TPA: hypothetical protein [Siphoviridae sp. ct89S11]
MLERVLYFGAGAIAGGLGVYVALSRKFERDFQEATIDINKELAEIAEAKHKAEVGAGADPEGSEPDPEHVVSEAIVDYSPTPVDDSDQEVVQKRTLDRQHFEAYQITREEYMAKGHQEHVELTYYMEDDVFADNRGVPMQNTEWFDNIISGVSASDTIIYIRSMSRHADFEVTLLDDSYEHTVLGVEPYEDE